MIVKLQPAQISAFWDAIKHMVLQTTPIRSERTELYLNNVFANLLSDKFQVWVSFEKDGSKPEVFYTMAITAILEDILYGYKYLMIKNAYGFRKMSDAMAKEGINAFEEFARTHDCEYLAAETSVDRVRHILDITSFKEYPRIYYKEV